jgi:hypothetical protein
VKVATILLFKRVDGLFQEHFRIRILHIVQLLSAYLSMEKLSRRSRPYVIVKLSVNGAFLTCPITRHDQNSCDSHGGLRTPIRNTHGVLLNSPYH